MRGSFVAKLGLLAALVGCGPALRTDTEPAGELALIPLPLEVSASGGHVYLDEDARVAVSAGAEEVGELLAAALRGPTGLALEVVTEPPRVTDLALSLDAELSEELADEGYRLMVDDDGIAVRAPAAAGLFYGTQTLRQLLPPEIEGDDPVAGREWRVPKVVIEDRPRFAWRGAMLDVARHFFDATEVRRLIDVVAHYKMNRFHLHLSDDQGWRIEIASWPDLALVGGSTEVGGGPGGFFTQAELADLAAYAATRYVTLVPEIDVPGHVNAALASYAELNESGVAAAPYTGTAVGFSALWLEGESTHRFVEDVVRELAIVTPGPYLHLGGDEAHATEHEDYVTFLEWVQGVVTANGKTLVGWEEVATAELAAPFLAQHWRDRGKAALAPGMGGLVIASPATSAYLDMRYDLETPVGLFWAGFVDVRTAYEWEPVSPELPEEALAGVEAPLWTETVETREHIDLLMFPRVLGHAEIGWSAAGRDWEAYRTRLGAHGPRMEARGIGFYRSDELRWGE